MEFTGKEFKTRYTDRPWLKLYPEGVSSDVEIPEKSVPQAFDETVAKYKNKTALVYYGRKMSYAELKDSVDRLATGLYNLGVRKGDNIALLLLNCPQFVIVCFAGVKLGAAVTPISPMYVSLEVKHQLEDSQAKLIICQDILYPIVEKTGIELPVILTGVGEYLPTLARTLGKGPLSAVYKKMSVPSSKIYHRENFYNFQDLIKNNPPNPPEVEVNPKEDVISIPYSGGTTGLPKGIMLTHHNLMSGRVAFTTFYSYEEGKEVIIAFMPFYHIGGHFAMFNGILQGDTLVLFTNPDFDAVLSAVGKYKATLFVGTPAAYAILNEHDKTDRVDWKHFKALEVGGDAVLADIVNDWMKRVNVPLSEIWGMTETFLTGTANPKGKEKMGSIGIPIPNTAGAIVHPEKNEFLPPGELGEFIFKGPQVMKGYWNNPEETKLTLVDIDGETWLRTGDLMTMDDDGYFYFYDRKRDMIKYKGYSVFAREVEEVLTSHPKIKEAGVVGVPDPKVGEMIKVYIVLEVEARGKLSEEEIIEYCKERLAHYKVPRIIEFRGEVPKTDVGKVSRRELREE